MAAILEHIALKARDLDLMDVFYSRLGGRTSWPSWERLLIEFDGGSRLMFDRAGAVDAGAMTSLGVELADFAAVDASFLRFSDNPALDRDLRETYRHATGPYGFLVRDPSGYMVKVFNYNEVTP